MAAAVPVELIPEEAPSTSPLDQSLDRLLGKKKTKGSSVSYAPSEFPVPDFRPGQDTINVSGVPATGATTAESWSHDIALENLRRQALETEYTQRTAAQEFAYKQQQAALENARQAAQLQLSQAQGASQMAQTAAQMGIARSGEARAQQQFGLQAQQMGLQAQETQQAMALKQAAEAREAAKFLTANLGMTPAQQQQLYQTSAEYNRSLAGQPISAQSGQQFAAYYNTPQYGQPAQPIWNANTQQWMATATPTTYQPKPSSQVYNIYGQHVGNW